MDRVVGIIPARMSSTRLPGKPLKIIGRRPMIQWVYEAAASAGVCAKVLVATDSLEIFEAVKNFGGEAVMTSPDHLTGTDRLAEAAAKVPADIILNIQGDEPFISPDLLRELAEVLIREADIPMGTVVAQIKREEAEDPNVVKVVLDAESCATYFSRALIPYPRKAGAEEKPFLKHLGLYAYRRDFLLRFTTLPPAPAERSESLEQLRALYHGFRIKVVMTDEESIGVDTPEDLAKARAWAEKIGL